MGDRRMLSKTVVETDNFLDLSLSAQALYFHLTMGADDEGFLCTVRSTARSIGVTANEITELQAAGLLYCFDSGVAVIRHWLIANTLRPDRRHETQFTAERALVAVDDNGVYCLRSEMEDDNIDEETHADNGQPSAEVPADTCQPTDNQMPRIDNHLPRIDNHLPRIDNHLQTEDNLSKVNLREAKKSEEKRTEEKEREGVWDSLPRSDEDSDTAKGADGTRRAASAGCSTRSTADVGKFADAAASKAMDAAAVKGNQAAVRQSSPQAGERDALSQDFRAGDALSTDGNTVNKGAADMAAGKVNGHQAAVRQTAQNGSPSRFFGTGDVPSTDGNTVNKGAAGMDAGKSADADAVRICDNDVNPQAVKQGAPARSSVQSTAGRTAGKADDVGDASRVNIKQAGCANSIQPTVHSVNSKTEERGPLSRINGDSGIYGNGDARAIGNKAVDNPQTVKPTGKNGSPSRFFGAGDVPSTDGNTVNKGAVDMAAGKSADAQDKVDNITDADKPQAVNRSNPSTV